MNKELKKHGIKVREKIYQFILDYISENGFAPTVREIGEEVKISVSNVAHHLTMLEIEGRIKIKENSPRAIKVIGYNFVKIEE